KLRAGRLMPARIQPGARRQSRSHMAHGERGMTDRRRIIQLDQLRMADLAQVGGKNASLGEMISQLAGQGVRVPGGFATTAFAFREFIEAAGLAARIESALGDLDVDDVGALARVGADLRGWIEAASLPEALVAEVAAAYERLNADSP